MLQFRQIEEVNVRVHAGLIDTRLFNLLKISDMSLSITKKAIWKCMFDVVMLVFAQKQTQLTDRMRVQIKSRIRPSIK